MVSTEYTSIDLYFFGACIDVATTMIKWKNKKDTIGRAVEGTQQ